MTGYLPPHPNRVFADHGRRLDRLERRVDEKKLAPIRRGAGPFVTVAASDTPESLALHATYKCDGTADQEEINAAIDHVGPGGLVLLLQGSFSTSGTLSPGNSSTLRGSGQGTTSITSTGTTAIAVSGYDVTIADLSINVNDGGGGILITSHGATIENCKFSSLASEATPTTVPLVVSSSHHTLVAGCRFEQRGHTIALSLQDLDSLVIGCVFNTVARGIDLVGNRNHVVGNRFFAALEAIVISGDENAVLANCLQNGTTYGVRLTATAALNFVAANDLIDPAGAELVDAGTGTVISANRPDSVNNTGGGAHSHADADIPATIARDAEVTAAVDAHAATPHGGSGQAATPYYVPAGETFTVPQYAQVLFSVPMVVDGALDLEGILVEVTEAPDLSVELAMIP